MQCYRTEYKLVLVVRCFLALDRQTSYGPAVEARFEMAHVGEAHLLEHVRRKGRPTPARSIRHNAFFRVYLAAGIL